MDTSKVTRFELIDGDRYTRYGVAVRLELQDGGRTLKVFLSDSPVPAETVAAQMRDGWRDEPASRPPEPLGDTDDLLSW